MVNQILVATNNTHKLDEIREILIGYDINSLKDAGIYIDIEENGNTFFENALIKAKIVSQISNRVVLADDSGLIIDALQGDPGINSARYAGSEADDSLNRKKVLCEMQGIKDRSAVFHTTLVLYFPDGRIVNVEGEIEGEISTEEIGNNGFGYDSIFIVKDLGLTFAELTPEQKNAISHRKIALRRLLKVLNN